MDDPEVPWRSTTHDWATSEDLAHVEQIRRGAARFAPGGTVHLVLEVVAYAADEADEADGGPRQAVITLLADGVGVRGRRRPGDRPARRPPGPHGQEAGDGHQGPPVLSPR